MTVYRGVVTRYVRKISGKWGLAWDEFTAEEAVQDVFVKLLRSLPNYQPGRPNVGRHGERLEGVTRFTTYLYKVVFSAVADKTRESRRAVVEPPLPPNGPDDGWRRDILQAILERVAAEVRSRLAPYNGYDLRLMSSVNDVSAIPTAGKRLVIVSAVDHVLHFRIFDNDGKMVVDTDATRRTAQAAQINDLSKQLDNLWPPHELTTSEKRPVIDAVTSIVGQTSNNPAKWRSFEEHILNHRPANAVAAELGITKDLVYQNASRVLKLVREQCRKEYEEELDGG